MGQNTPNIWRTSEEGKRTWGKTGENDKMIMTRGHMKVKQRHIPWHQQLECHNREKKKRKGKEGCLITVHGWQQALFFFRRPPPREKTRRLNSESQWWRRSDGWKKSVTEHGWQVILCNSWAGEQSVIKMDERDKKVSKFTGCAEIGVKVVKLTFIWVSFWVSEK